jgi:hypothetical protein
MKVIFYTFMTLIFNVTRQLLTRELKYRYSQSEILLGLDM